MHDNHIESWLSVAALLTGALGELSLLDIPALKPEISEPKPAPAPAAAAAQ